MNFVVDEKLFLRLRFTQNNHAEQRPVGISSIGFPACITAWKFFQLPEHLTF